MWESVRVLFIFVILLASGVVLNFERYECDLDPVPDRHADEILAVQVVVVRLWMSGRAQLGGGLREETATTGNALNLRPCDDEALVAGAGVRVKDDGGDAAGAGDRRRGGGVAVAAQQVLRAVLVRAVPNLSFSRTLNCF